MPRYFVDMTAYRVHTTRVEVEADNPEEAEEAAVDLADEADWDLFPDDGSVQISVDRVEEVLEEEVS